MTDTGHDDNASIIVQLRARVALLERRDAEQREALSILLAVAVHDDDA